MKNGNEMLVGAAGVDVRRGIDVHSLSALTRVASGLGLALMVATSAVAGGAQSSIVAGYRFTSFDVSGSADTIPHNINDAGTVVGLYHDSTSGNGHSFIRAADGHITTFDAPDGGIHADAEGINSEGAIVGWYYDANFTQHGYLRDRRGTISTVDVPFPGSQGSVAWVINDAGTVVGYYFDANGIEQIFRRSPEGHISTVSVPGNVFGAESNNINNRGLMDGSYFDSNTVGHGFLREVDGSIVSFDAPGAGIGNGQGTWTVEGVAAYHRGMNERGDLIGAAVDSNYTAHGFLREHDGNSVSFDVPGGGVGNYNGTIPVSINSSGRIVGNVCDSNAVCQGFVRHRGGSIVQFSAPGVGTQILPFSMNDSGVITGFWFDADGNTHGFVMTPVEQCQD